MRNNNNSKSFSAPASRRHVPNKPEQGQAHELGCVEWNTSTKALAEFLSALGVFDPGRIARSLIEEFGSLSDFLSASSWRLSRVVGRQLARTIQSSHQLMRAMLEEEIPEGPLVTRSKEFVDFLQVEMGFLQHEQLLAVFVDRGCRLMRIECLAVGSFKEAPIDKRKIIGCALNIGAAAFFLIHNHPSGMPFPSTPDLRVTEDLKRLAASFDINLLDHLIVARGDICSIEECWQKSRECQPPGSVADASSQPPLADGTCLIQVDASARAEFERLTQALLDAAIEIMDLSDGDPDIEPDGEEFEDSDGV